MSDPTSGWPLRRRLLLGQGAVLVANLLAASLVAILVGPPLFHRHLVEAGHLPAPHEMAHLERAYRDANLVSLSLALVTALACALAVTWFVAQRIQRPLTELTSAAGSMAAGDYSTRVDAPGAGPELTTLASAFNAMAGRLDEVESTRRRLLTDLAHEMRTPLATLNAYLEALDDGVRTWDEETRDVLTQQTARLSRLAADLDDVSSAEEGRLRLSPEPVSVSELVSRAIATATPAFQTAEVHLVGDAPGAATVEVDPDRFAQVLTNLLDNARRHTPAGGRVDVRSEVVGHLARITVADTGEGIDATQLPHVFERFYRGDSARDRRRSGSGIGLTISRAIVRAHGGTLTAESPGRGQGSTFTIELPLL